MGDLIDRQAAIDAIDEISREVDDGDGFDYEKWREYFCELPPAEPKIIRCKDCKYWVPGYITDKDDFIPPKCGEWQQMVGHSSDDYCSLAERREVTT
jgi:hypothetical protein